MRILICANKDIYANLFLNHFLEQNSQHTISVLFSVSIGGKKPHSPMLDYLKSYEQDLFNNVIFPRASKNVAKDGQLKTYDQLSDYHGVSMRDVQKINSPEETARVQAWKPDIILSVRFGQILKEPVIQIPKYGVINVHSGLLPEYRGVMATFWSLLHGDGEYGYTVHRIMDTGIDTGDVLERRVLQSEPGKSLFCHIADLYPLAAASLTNVVNTLNAGESLKGTPQSSDGAAYYSYPEDEHFEQFQAKGYTLVNEVKHIELLNQYSCKTEE